MGALQFAQLRHRYYCVPLHILFSNRVVVQPWHSLHTLTLSHNKITHLDDSLQILPALREVREGRREGERERERGREGRIERERRKGGIEGERVRERMREGGRREGGRSEEEKGYFDEEKELRVQAVIIFMLLTKTTIALPDIVYKNH